MLKHLSINNFQSHKDTAIEFDPRLTVLVGPSNNGKTAIIRAIRWVLSNRPRGSSFIRNTADSATVRLDGVSREKGRKGGDGRYMIDGETLTALGGEVPQQVKDQFGMTDVNIADQLSQHFLVLDAPGQIARTINEAVHLERAEAAVKSADSETRSAKQSVKATKQTLEAVDLASKALGWVDKVRLRLDAVTALETNVGRSRGIVESIRQVAGELGIVGKRIEGVRLPVGALALAGTLSERAEKVLVDRKRLELHRQIVRHVGIANTGIAECGEPAELLKAARTLVMTAATNQAGCDKRESLQRLLNELKQVDKSLPTWPICQAAAEAERLADKAGKWQQGVKAYNVLYDMHEGLIELGQNHAFVTIGIAKDRNEERELMEGLTECPTCGQELDETAKGRLLNE